MTEITYETQVKIVKLVTVKDLKVHGSK